MIVGKTGRHQAKRTSGPVPAVNEHGIFQGTPNQLWAMTLVAEARGALEDFHAGYHVDPESRVTWGSHSSLFGEVARLDPRWVAAFAKKFAEESPEKIVNFEKALRKHDAAQLAEIILPFTFATRWQLPIIHEDWISRIMPKVDEAVFRGSGSKRPPRERLARVFAQDTFIVDYLAPLTKGNRGPLKAHAHNEQVTIEIKGQSLPWTAASLLSDTETKGFNIGLSNRVYSLLTAIDRSRNWEETGVPLNISVYQIPMPKS